MVGLSLVTRQKRSSIVVDPRFVKIAPHHREDNREDNTVRDIARHYARDIRLLQSGNELFAEGEAAEMFFVVLDGWLVQYRILEDGRRQILDFALPGAVLGLSGGAAARYGYSVEAIGTATVAALPTSSLSDILSVEPEFAVALLSSTGAALESAFDSLTDTGRRTAREAVAHFLLRIEQRIRQDGDAAPDGAVEFPLIQEHIGDALGLTAVHVCRTLRKLRSEGLVEVGRGKLRITNRRGLALTAGVFHEQAAKPRLAC